MGLRCRFYRPLYVAFLLILFHHATGQVVAGIAVNGRVVGQGDTVNVCQGSALKFQSVAQGSINIEWRFTGASLTVAQGIGPFGVNYNTAGFDTVFQKITGGNYSDSTYCIVQVSNDRPTANFSWAPNGECGNDPVQFTNLSTGDHLSYRWDFGDGGSSSAASPSYPFLNAVGVSGTSNYTVVMSVSNNYGCNASVSRTVTVKNTPDASIGNADPEVQFNIFNGNATFKKCNNIPSYTFSFTNKSTTNSINTGYTIHWGDGSPDSIFSSWPAAVVIAHTFPLGSSTMTVKVSGANGCTGIKNYIVFLGSTPAGGLASLGNTDICASDSLRFNINNISGNPPGTLYTFLINDGNAAEVFTHPPPSTVGHFFSVGSCGYTSSSGNSNFNNAFGAYLTIENPCGTTSPSVVPIYVSGKPRANIVVTPANTVCTNSPVRIQSASTYGSVITATGGTSSTCTNSGVLAWVISPATGYTFVNGSTGSLNGSPLNGQLWTGGTADLNVIFTKAGTYTVKLYVYNNRCGMDSTVQTICVRIPPQASFTMPSRRRCGPGVLQLTNTSPIGTCGGDAYEWKVSYLDPQGCGNGQNPAYSFTGGSSATSYSPSLALSSPGKYALQLTVTALNAGLACSPGIYTDTFIVAGSPKVSLVSPGAICPGNGISPLAQIDSCYSPGPFSYQWTFGGGLPADAVSLVPGTISYASTGSFQVSLAVTDNFCTGTTTATANLSVVPPPVARAGADTTLCSGDPVRLGAAAVAGVSYHWRPSTGLSNPDTAAPLLSASYTGTASDTTFEYIVEASFSSSCSKTDTVLIKVKRKPSVLIDPPGPAFCIGDSVQVSASGADVYTWSPSPARVTAAGDAAVLKPGISTVYTVIGRYNSGCPDTVTAPVTVHPDARALFTASSTTVCSGVKPADLITVTPYPSLDGLYNWWANGTPIGSNTTGVFPSWSFGGAGETVLIKLVATSLFGCKPDSMEVAFHTIPGVAAHFTKSGAAGCGPLRVYFGNTTGPAAAAQYFWDFGNGQGSLLAQPDSISFLPSPYHRDTTYFISLRATNGCDTTVWKDSVTVYPDPRAAFTVSGVLGCSPFADTLINLSTGNNTSYNWDFGDGTHQTVSTLADLVHLYHTGVIDTFTITLQATNRCGVHMDSLDVVVTPNSIRPNILANGNALFGCAPFNASFVNNSSGAAQITVDFNDGSVPVVLAGNQPTISHQYLKAGIFNVIMRLTNSCVDTSISRSVTVFAAPVPAFSIDPNPVCTGNAVNTSNLSANGNSYLWDWGDSSHSNGENSVHVYGKAGAYSVQLTASLVNNFGTVCRVSSPPVVVRVVDLIPARIDTGNTRPCVPYNLMVTALGATEARSVDWTFYDDARSGGLFRASGMTAAYQYNNPGTYRVMLVVENAGGCADTTIHTFYVSASPTLTAASFGSLYTCNMDTTLHLSVSATYAGVDPLSYSWTINEQPVGSGNPFEYRLQGPADSLSPSSYAFRAMVSNEAGCSDTAAMGTVGLRPLAAPHIVVRPDSILYQPEYTFTFMDDITRVIPVRYVWDAGDMNGVNTGREMVHKYGDTGTYQVKLRVSDEVTGCYKDDITHVRIVYVPGYLYVPDAICPGCGVAELRQFLPKARGLKEYHLRIYNTWGQLIFETRKLDGDGAPSEPWNARWDGQTVKQDAYRWQIEARYVNGTEWKGMLYPNQGSPVKSGFITVVR